MSSLSSEVRNIQNPALGAVALWQFVRGYEGASQTNQPVPLPLMFLVLPIVLHREIRSFVSSTRKGLRAFASKFGESKHSKQDLLLSIHGRADLMKELSIESLRVGIATSLISMNKDGTAFSVARGKCPTKLDDTTQLILSASAKLGSWCEPLTIPEIGSILFVRF